MANQLKRFIETYRGSSFPTRSETADGGICVVKMRGAGNGASALLSEFVVNRLAHAAGLPVPEVSVVRIPAGFPWGFGTDEFHDLVRKSPGENLGIAWLDGAQPIPTVRYGSLPPDFVSRIVTIDLVFANVDRTARSDNLLQDREQKCWIIDHGSCRFLFQPTPVIFPVLPADHIFSGREETFDATWLKPVTSALIARTVDEIPAEWLVETGLTSGEVARLTAARLDFFRKGRWAPGRPTISNIAQR